MMPAVIEGDDSVILRKVANLMNPVIHETGDSVAKYDWPASSALFKINLGTVKAFEGASSLGNFAIRHTNHFQSPQH